MSLDLQKLEKVVDLAEGMKRARCPACAEAGQDRKGEHLRIYPDGRFGCCVHPANTEHRKRIYSLAGDRGKRGIRVRVAEARNSTSVQAGILRRLGRVFGDDRTDGTDGEVEARSADCKVQNVREEGRTLRTGETESKTRTSDEAEGRTERTGPGESEQNLFNYSRTLRTTQYSHVYAEEFIDKDVVHIKEFAEPVRSVRVLAAPAIEKSAQPHLLSDGTLVIPFNSPERYHWWKGGQSIRQTISELLERKENDASPF